MVETQETDFITYQLDLNLVLVRSNPIPLLRVKAHFIWVLLFLSSSATSRHWHLVTNDTHCSSKINTEQTQSEPKCTYILCNHAARKGKAHFLRLKMKSFNLEPDRLDGALSNLSVAGCFETDALKGPFQPCMACKAKEEEPKQYKVKEKKYKVITHTMYYLEILFSNLFTSPPFFILPNYWLCFWPALIVHWILLVFQWLGKFTNPLQRW